MFVLESAGPREAIQIASLMYHWLVHILHTTESIIHHCSVCNFLKMNYKPFCNVYIRVCVGLIKSHFHRR